MISFLIFIFEGEAIALLLINFFLQFHIFFEALTLSILLKLLFPWWHFLVFLPILNQIQYYL